MGSYHILVLYVLNVYKFIKIPFMFSYIIMLYALITFYVPCYWSLSHKKSLSWHVVFRIETRLIG